MEDLIDQAEDRETSAEDGAWWTDATNNLFKTENQPAASLKIVFSVAE